ncbi:Uncharacterised protein [Mycobacterium tuberculosis]|nr:Uncharacterised protein [Mycobacterium tuberculosis]
MLCTKPLRATALSGVRARMLSSTRLSGNMIAVSPKIATHSGSATAGNSSSPPSPRRPAVTATKNSGRVAWNRTTSTGTSMEQGRPTSANNDSRKPAVAGLAPPRSTRMVGSQAKAT